MAEGDREIIEHIDQLVAEEHALESRHHEGETLSHDEQQRRRGLEEHLDRLWDLLRQRRARRDAGLDPDDASERGTDTVEGYRQ